MEIHLTKVDDYRSLNKNVVLQITLLLLLFTLVTLQSFNIFPIKNPLKLIISSSLYANDQHEEASTPRKCDIFSGEWIPNMEGPYYTNYTCSIIHEYQNCMKHGRPDTEYMKWRWKPNECELPIFNPNHFMEIVKGKSLAFVGDSVARNHMQSLVCLLSQVEHPLDISPTKDDNFKRWYFPSYNFTIAMFWSPFLVKAQYNDPNGIGKDGNMTFNGLFLDESDDTWTTQIDDMDYIIISAGHWFFGFLFYYEKGQVMGCRYCGINNLTDNSLSYGYRKAFQTSFRAILDRQNFTGNVYLRTFSPSHFEGGEWNQGGDCVKKRPIKSNETNLSERDLEMYKAQLEAFNEAKILAQQRGVKFGLLDMTRIMLMRPDGHPSKYGSWLVFNGTKPNDCVHWCLPGPIDSWNDFLLELLRDEEKVLATLN